MTNYLPKIFFFSLFLSCQVFIYGQDFLCKTENFFVENGLSNRFVRTMIQDYKGFMWFGTKHGLNRYDGNLFKVFTQEQDNLQANFINQLYEDADNKIWIAYPNNNNFFEFFGSMDIMDVNTFKVQPIEEVLKLPVPLKDIYRIYRHPKNKDLYLGTRDGRIYIYKGKNTFELFYTHPQKTIIEDFLIGEQYCWLYCDNKLLALDSLGQVLETKALESNLEENLCRFIGEIDRHNIYFLTYNKSANKRTKIAWGIKSSLPAKSFFNTYIDTLDIAFRANFYQDLLLGTSVYWDRRRLFLFGPQGNLFYEYNFPNQFIHSFYVDRQGNIWLGVHNRGLCKISYQENKFKPYFVGESIRAITTIQEDSVLLANSYGGILLYNSKTQESSRIEFSKLDLVKSKNGRDLWLSSEQVDLERFDLDKMVMADTVWATNIKGWNIPKPPNGLSLNWAVYEDKNEKIWIGTGRGIGYLDKGADSIQAFQGYNDFSELEGALVNYFYENKEGIWIASSLGLYLLDLDKGIVKRYAQKLPPPYEIPHHNILNIHEDKSGLFWLSTRGGGIIKLNLKTGSHEQFTSKQGLSHDVIYAIIEDDEGYFWMSSDYGLMRFNPQNYLVNTYLPRDGLLHEEFNHLAAYKAPNGRIYFGGVQGVIGLNPKNFTAKKNYEIPLQIIRYQYFDGQKGLLLDKTKELLKDPQIVLDYTNRFFILDFALLDFKANKGSHYAYKIEGLDEDWHYLDANSIRINGLPVGKYTLLIKGQGSKGIWSSSELNIPILVKQPFYLTWQFFLAIFLIILAYARWRVLRLRKAKKELEEEVKKRTQKIEEQTQELKELDNVKSRFFANISHELRTPLTLMLGPVNAILGKHYGNDLEKIHAVLDMTKRNGIKLQSLIEEILVLSKLEGNALEISKQAIAFYPFIRRLFAAFEAQAVLQGITWVLEMDEKEAFQVLLDSNKVEKIINNLLSNALKFTPRSGTVRMRVSLEWTKENEGVMQLQVIDSGKGILEQDLPNIFNRFYQSKDKDAIVQGGSGIGLALAYELAQLLGGELSVKSQWGKGSVFTFILPMELSKRSVLESSLEEDIVAEIPPSFFPESSENNLTKACVLVVEDNEDMRLFIEDLLGAYYHVKTAVNGRVALEYLEKEADTIDLILSDVMMPELDGFQLLQKVKEHPQWQQLPMILLTARAAEKDKLAALQIGVDDYLQKPFSHEELFVRIKNLLKNYHQRKTWQKEAPVEEEEVVLVPNLPKEDSISDEWMKDLDKVVQKGIGDPQFGINTLAEELNISERHLRRKIKLKTGLSPNQYLRLIKLEMARNYLEAQTYKSISEVAHQIGFSNVNHFSKIYYEQYGKKTSDYFN